MSDDVLIRTGSEHDLDDVLGVLGAAYGSEQFTPEWFRWKHCENPEGPSRLYVAQDESEILGLFFAMPWPLRAAGTHIDGVRLVDGAVMPAARGRRVLGRLVRAEVDRWGVPDRPGILMATATPEAQRSHARNGAETLSPIAMAYGVCTSLSSAKLDHGDHVLDTIAAQRAPEIGTDWTTEWLRWRIDEHSGKTYEVAGLASSEGPNGLIYRVLTLRGLRVLVPLVAWGAPTEQRRLVGAVARTSRSAAVLAASGPGAAPQPFRKVRGSGQSVMCVWDLRSDTAVRHPAGRNSSWLLSMADLEGVI